MILAFISLPFVLLFQPSVVHGANQPLECRPIASASTGAEEAKPMICAPTIVRDELLTYLNLAEIYRLDPENAQTRFVDKVELVSDLAQNGFFLGKGEALLKLNSFLRIKDAKSFLEEVKKRISLAKASAETSRLMTELALGPNTYRLNVEAPLKSFLDGPFIGEAGNVITAATTPETETNSAPHSILAPPTDPGVVVSLNKNCTALRSALKERKEALIKERDDLYAAIEKYNSWLALRPTHALQHSENDGKISALSKSNEAKKLTPTQLAEHINDSECDRCFEAVHHCKALGLLEGHVPTTNNCTAVRRNDTCYRSLPATLSVPVEICYGVPRSHIRSSLNAPLRRWNKKAQSLSARIKALEQSLNDSGPGGCTDPERSDPAEAGALPGTPSAS